MRIAISYIRWSSLQQGVRGESKRRQFERTEKFCSENGLVLDRTLVDDGKSAYKGKHRATGTALSRFLQDVQDGRIPSGTVLIVESLDRLSREEVPVALESFLGILRNGVDIVTLIDHQWYSRKTLGSDPAPLLISIVSMMRAHDEVKHRAERLSAVWENKRQQAAKAKAPMTSICPGWLFIRPDKSGFNVIPDRVRKVKLIFWLFIRGWSKQHIVRLLNRHKVPTWGVGGKAANGWHPSYVQKIISNRAVLGEFLLHSTRFTKNGESTSGRRHPVSGKPIKNYYPQIISEAVFRRAQMRCSGPRGPIGKSVANLFQGLLKDGLHPEFTMIYRDHGDQSGKWRYVVSDYRRVDPSAQLFSWNYNELEQLLISYLCDLDWSELTATQTAEIRKLREDLAVAEGRLQDFDAQAKNLVATVKIAPEVVELAAELRALETQRTEIRQNVANLRSTLRQRQGFALEDGAVVLKKFAAERTKPAARLRLRDAIRRYVRQIELYPSVPGILTKGVKLPVLQRGVKLQDMLHGRCVRILFANDSERWVVDRKLGLKVRIDGKWLPKRHLIVNRDEMTGGYEMVDKRKDSKAKGSVRMKERLALKTLKPDKPKPKSNRKPRQN